MFACCLKKRTDIPDPNVKPQPVPQEKKVTFAVQLAVVTEAEEFRMAYEDPSVAEERYEKTLARYISKFKSHFDDQRGDVCVTVLLVAENDFERKALKGFIEQKKGDGWVCKCTENQNNTFFRYTFTPQMVTVKGVEVEDAIAAIALI